MRHNENLALYLFGVIALAACFAAFDETAWIGALIILSGALLGLGFEIWRGIDGKGKRKRKNHS